MNERAGLISALAAVALVGWAAAPALGRPPTVGVNPGYDRRLIESRKEQPGADVAPVTTAPVRHKRHTRHRY